MPLSTGCRCECGDPGMVVGKISADCLVERQLVIDCIALWLADACDIALLQTLLRCDVGAVPAADNSNACLV